MNTPQPSRLETSFLRAHGIRLPWEEFLTLIEDVVSTLPARSEHDIDEELTGEELAALERGGLDLRRREHKRGSDPIARGAVEFARLIQESLSVPAAAQLLGVDESRIRQRLTARPPSLYGFIWEKRWKVPLFQFAEGGLVPHISQVAAVLPRELHPLAVERWFTAPSTDLLLDEEAPDQDVVRLSPKQWLLQGRDPAPVVHMARHLR